MIFNNVIEHYIFKKNHGWLDHYIFVVRIVKKKKRIVRYYRVCNSRNEVPTRWRLTEQMDAHTDRYLQSTIIIKKMASRYYVQLVFFFVYYFDYNITYLITKLFKLDT